MATRGIDVSQWNGNINFDKVKAAGIDFVIIRAGYGRTATQKDPYFEQNYKGAKAAGLKVGAYWYSYAVSAADAKAEAAACMSIIKGKQFEYPIYFDLEEQSQFAKGTLFCSSLVRAFCDTLNAAGFYSGLYISRSPLQSYITADIKNKYPLWVAEYNSVLNYSGKYGMWQNSGLGKINGINGAVDTDFGYVDYPTIIKNGGYNGYSKNSTSKNNSTSKKSVEVIAREVIAGKWGNGDDRKKRITAAGYDCNAVQKKVNELIDKSVEYTVKNGDTLTSIAKKHNVTVDQIVKNNNLIKTGQKLKIK